MLGWCWIYEKEESGCNVSFCAGFASQNIRTPNTAYTVYNMYQSVALTMQQLVRIVKYVYVHHGLDVIMNGWSWKPVHCLLCVSVYRLLSWFFDFTHVMSWEIATEFSWKSRSHRAIILRFCPDFFEIVRISAQFLVSFPKKVEPIFLKLRFQARWEKP